MAAGTFTHNEIASQPAVWRSTLEEVVARQEQLASGIAGLAARPLIVTGCGSTYYLSMHAAAILRHAGVRAWALPASELVYFADQHLQPDCSLLAISRSGTTTETLWAIERFLQAQPQGNVVAITCSPETPMTAQAGLSLIAAQAQERSVAQTRSFTSMALLAQALAAFVVGDHDRHARLQGLPDALDA